MSCLDYGKVSHWSREYRRHELVSQLETTHVFHQVRALGVLLVISSSKLVYGVKLSLVRESALSSLVGDLDAQLE